MFIKASQRVSIARADQWFLCFGGVEGKLYAWFNTLNRWSTVCMYELFFQRHCAELGVGVILLHRIHWFATVHDDGYRRTDDSHSIVSGI